MQAKPSVLFSLTLPAKRPRRKPRHPNHRLVKIHRSYTLREVANLFAIHKNTVGAWIKHGLPTSDGKRPILILGKHLFEFLKIRRAKNKRACSVGELYCLKCRSPQKPAGGMAEFSQLTEKVGNLNALCATCETMMNRRVSFSKLGLFEAEMDIKFPQALRHIGERNQPTVNSDLTKGD